MKLPGILIGIVFCMTAVYTQAGETVKQRDEREAYQKQLQFRLNEINRKISELKTRPSDVNQESRTEFKQLSDQLQRTQNSAQKKMTELKSASGMDSDRLKAETHVMINQLDALHGRISELSK